jgi:hypothetical protein
MGLFGGGSSQGIIETKPDLNATSLRKIQTVVGPEAEMVIYRTVKRVTAVPLFETNLELPRDR